MVSAGRVMDRDGRADVTVQGMVELMADVWRTGSPPKTLASTFFHRIRLTPSSSIFSRHVGAMTDRLKTAMSGPAAKIARRYLRALQSASL